MNHDCRGDGVRACDGFREAPGPGHRLARLPRVRKFALAACKTLAFDCTAECSSGATGLLRCCHTSSNRLFLGLLAWLLLAFAATNRLGQRVGTARHSGSKASRGAAGI